MSTTMTTPSLTITGKAAQSIRRHVRTYVRPQSGHGWTEVQGMRECLCGCKLYVRRQGCVLRYALIHQESYGCQVQSRHVPVRLAR